MFLNDNLLVCFDEQQRFCNAEFKMKPFEHAAGWFREKHDKKLLCMWEISYRICAKK
jgi:hypothetical protein